MRGSPSVRARHERRVRRVDIIRGEDANGVAQAALGQLAADDTGRARAVELLERELPLEPAAGVALG